MYLTIGETKLLVGQYGDGNTEKLELNFEYLFDSHQSYRRFAQILADNDGNKLKIKIKAEFKNPSDCAKLSRLLTGVQKLITQNNLSILRNILKSNSKITPQHFVEQQTNLIKYFT